MSTVLTGREVWKVKISETEGNFQSQDKLHSNITGHALSYLTFFSSIWICHFSHFTRPGVSVGGILCTIFILIISERLHDTWDVPPKGQGPAEAAEQFQTKNTRIVLPWNIRLRRGRDKIWRDFERVNVVLFSKTPNPIFSLLLKLERKHIQGK